MDQPHRKILQYDTSKYIKDERPAPRMAEKREKRKVDARLEKLLATLHPLERTVLPHLKERGTLQELVSATKLQPVEVMRALQWLESKGLVTLEGKEEEVLLVKEKGRHAAKKLPEEYALEALKKKGVLLVEEIPKVLPAYDKGAAGPVIGKLKKMGVPFITTPEGKPAFKWVDLPLPELVVKKVLAKAAKQQWSLPLKNITAEERSALKELLRRQGYVELRKGKEKLYILSPRAKPLRMLKVERRRYAERLTPAMLQDGSWRKVTFRPYNVTINVPKQRGGRIHFVNEAITYIKRVWLDLGFQEMTGNHVQTAFWDLDVLFVPQDHPAREMQDTFYLAAPVEQGDLPQDLFQRVKKIHEDGGATGSVGWQAPFRKEESRKNLLRTHTTVLSAHTLAAIKEGRLPLPGKYFTIGTVYRNEALDWKHLFEFHQVEGIVVAEGMTLAHLKGYLKEFFGKMGFPDVRMRPAHFPYTEPSVEVDVWDPHKEEWVELGGAGIFRPEVTIALLGREVPVLAWGLGMERIIKEYYQFTDIRDLYRNDVEELKSAKLWLKT